MRFRELDAPSRKSRAILTKDQVLNIYEMKATASSSATNVGKMYGMSEKAIRDIWSGRTWAAETGHIDQSLGCYDTKRRKTKENSGSNTIKNATLDLANEVLQGTNANRFSYVDSPHDSSHLKSLIYPSGAEFECLPQVIPSVHVFQGGSQTHGPALDDQLLDWEYHKPGLEIEANDPFEADWARSKELLQNLCISSWTTFPD